MWRPKKHNQTETYIKRHTIDRSRRKITIPSTEIALKRPSNPINPTALSLGGYIEMMQLWAEHESRKYTS